MTVTGVAAGGVVVERSGACLAIRAATVAADHRIGAMLPGEPGRTAVVVDSSAAAALGALDRGLLGDLRRHLAAPPAASGRGLRLLVGGAARPGPHGSSPLAARLARELGVEVVAPDGPLVVLRRGELFSAGTAATWWAFAPDRHAEPLGPRFPPPAWQRELPADLGARIQGRQLTVTPVPAGLWVRGAPASVAELSDPGFAVPPAPELLAVLVGRPGEARPPVAGLAEVIAALPPALRDRYVLIPYGPEPAGAAPIAQRLADRLGHDVRATHGLPTYSEDGSLDIAVLDDAGRWAWRPFVTESVYHPGAEPPTRWTWRPPLAELPAAAPASFWLAAGWVVDVLPSGLLVRPATSAPEALALRRPVDPRHIDVVVTAASPAPENIPAPVLGAIGRLARALPSALRARLRMLITERVDSPGLVGLAGALRMPIRRLAGDGAWPVGADRPAPGAGRTTALPPEEEDPVSGIPAGTAPGLGADPADIADARPDSVGRLHASVVPTPGGPATPVARPPTVDTGRPAERPGRSSVPVTADGHFPAEQPERTAAPPAADECLPAGQHGGSLARPAQEGLAAAAAQPVPAEGGAHAGPGASVTVRMDGRIRPAPRRHPDSGTEPDVGRQPAPPIAGVTAPTAPIAGVTAPIAGVTAPTAPTVGVTAHPPGLVTQPIGTAVDPPAPEGRPSAGAAGPTHPTSAPSAPARQPAAAGPVPDGVTAGGAPEPVAAGPAVAVATPDLLTAVDQWWQRASTWSERQQFRDSLGWRYDAASRYVTRLLSERPGLRAAAATDEGVATDLAAVHEFAASDHTGRLASIRTGSMPAADRAFLSCLVSGLRRLPTLIGLVVRGGPDDPATAEAYLEASDVLEMGLLVAVAEPAATVPGGVEVLIWSSTARRLDGLVEGAAAAQVVFLPGTVFRVLDVDWAVQPRRVLMAEMPQNWRDRADADRDERIRGRLRAAARARAAGPTGGEEGSGSLDKVRPGWSAGTAPVALPGVVPAGWLRGVA